MSEITNQYYNDYVSYFKEIATNHVLLAHKDETSSKAFVRISIKEAVMGYDRIGIKKGFIMELIDPSIHLDHLNTGGMQYKNLQAGFQIIGHHKDGSDQEQLHAMTTSEEIANDILSLMRIHSRGGHPLFTRSFDIGETASYNFVTYERDGNWAGVRVIFDFKNARSTCIKQDNWLNDLEEDEHIQLSDLPEENT